MATSAAEVYDEHVRALPAAQRLELVALIASELATERQTASEKPMHRLTELEGLGKEIWEGIDAQEYVNRLRDEWHEPTP
jgi:hypothetical protein